MKLGDQVDPYLMNQLVSEQKASVTPDILSVRAIVGCPKLSTTIIRKVKKADINPLNLPRI